MDQKYVITTNCDRSMFYINQVQPDGSLLCVELVSGAAMMVASFRETARCICPTNCFCRNVRVSCAGCGSDVTADEGDGYCIPCSNGQYRETDDDLEDLVDFVDDGDDK